jgi:hypothetical protein
VMITIRKMLWQYASNACILVFHLPSQVVYFSYR